jgi:hypothetical protein
MIVLTIKHIYDSEKILLMAKKVPLIDRLSNSLSTTGLAHEAAATKDTKNHILFIAKNSAKLRKKIKIIQVFDNPNYK